MTEFATLTCHCILNGWAISKCLDKVSRHNTLYLQCLEHGQSICKWMFLVDALMLWANGEFWGGNSPAQRGYSPHIYQSLGWFVPSLGVSRVGGHGIGPRRLNPAQIPIIRLVPMFFMLRGLLLPLYTLCNILIDFGKLIPGHWKWVVYLVLWDVPSTRITVLPTQTRASDNSALDANRRSIVFRNFNWI